MAIRIALVEDDAGFAEALRRFFKLSPSVELVAVFSSSEEALAKLAEFSPEVILVDINLPKMNGIEFVARIKQEIPSVLCLILTMYEESPMIFDALQAGACGYLLKRTAPSEIVLAIEQVQSGGSPMSPQIARQVVSFFHGQAAKTPNLINDLTRPESEVLELLSQGFMYKEIADQLELSLDTVRNRLRKIYEKLHVHSRTDAILKYFGRK